MAKNIYGVQKVKEPEVRDGLDIATATAGAAAKGAQMGSKFGPWGAAGGAVIAGGFALANQKAMQRDEEVALKGAESRNEFAENLEDRALRENTMVQAQARYGMNPKSKYETAEIEGDGSGSANGIGEIHVDKDYNIKNIARGGEKHEDGGFEINNLEKEDVIFPTQDNEEEFNRVLGAINRWKLKRDPRAKKFLDRTRDRLPTDEDYGYDTKEFPKGKGQRKKDKEFNKQVKQLIKDVEQKQKEKESFEKTYPDIDYEWYLSKGGIIDGMYDSPDGSIEGAWDAEKDNWEETKFKEFMDSTPEQRQVMIESGNIPKSVMKDPQKAEKWENFAEDMLSNSNQGETVDQMQSRVDPYRGMTQLDRDEAMLNDQMSDAEKAKNDEPEPTLPYAKNIPTAMGPKDQGNPSFKRYNMRTDPSKIVDARGNSVINNDAKGKGISQEELKESQRKASLKKQYEDAMKDEALNGPYVPEDNNITQKTLDIEEEDFGDDGEDEPLEEMPFLKQDPTKIGERYGGQYYTKEDGTKVYTKDLMDADKRKYSSEKEKEEEDNIWDEITKMEKYNNPGKYASMINKSIQGSKPIEGAERRFITSDKYKYEDMSAKDRQDNVEARNFQNLSMRGKGLSAGQIQSYGAQNAAQYYGNAERINAAENERRYKTDQANVDLGNRDKQTNLSLANQYDAIERQQRAVRQKYKDASYSDFSKLAQLDEQAKYMQNKDRKMFLRDKATLPFLGTKNMQIGPDGVKYIVDADGQRYYAK